MNVLINSRTPQNLHCRVHRTSPLLLLPQTRRKPSSTSSSSSTSDLSDDPDTEEALRGFDFLTSPDETDGPPEGGAWGEEEELQGQR